MNNNEFYLTGREFEDYCAVFKAHITTTEFEMRREKNHCIVLTIIIIINAIIVLALLIDNDYGFIAIILFCVLLYLLPTLYTMYQNSIYKLMMDKEGYNENIKEVVELWNYVYSYRKLEALEYDIYIYPQFELEYCENIVKQYDFELEQKRIEYENAHIEYLKQNPDILKEKLNKAPIETYPLSEQKLLREYKEKNTSIIEKVSENITNNL